MLCKSNLPDCHPDPKMRKKSASEMAYISFSSTGKSMHLFLQSHQIADTPPLPHFLPVGGFVGSFLFLANLEEAEQ